jgi:hypoxanthine-guanine phosphoribosyltransferase
MLYTEISMLTYNSLFDKVTSDDLNRFYAYKGTINQIIEELKTEVPKPTLIYHPTRIIKGLIDYKVKHPEKEIIHSLIRYMTELTKEIYSIHAVQIFKLTNFKLMLLQHEMNDFLNFEVIQEEDTAACLSSIGRLTQKTALRIFNATKGKDILLIPMAHGATAPGIDLHLRYSILTQNNFSTVYPCRFSVHKQKDESLQLDTREKLYLSEQSKNKEVVIFEENIVTGQTIEKVQEYFKLELLSHTPLLSVTNLDISKTEGKEASSNNHEEMLKQFLLQYEDTTSAT